MIFFKNNSDTVGSRIKLAIHIRGETPASIDRKTGIAKSYISRAINNKISNPKKLIQVISEELKISSDWIMTGQGRMDIEPDNRIPIYCIKADQVDGYIIIKMDNLIENNTKAWKGINTQPYNEESIIISIDNKNNTPGEYLSKINNDYKIITRYNDQYSTKWFGRGDLEEIMNIEDYEIIGYVVATFMNLEIKKIEI